MQNKSDENKSLTPLARQLRRDQTLAEQRIWKHLRNRQVGGHKFKRQHPIDEKYIADFICLEKRLIIELDGGQHSDDVDRERTAYLEAQGFTVLRFSNYDILKDTDDVLQTIYCLLTPSP
ncbi:MAG: endonuclease domain-containing protein [Alphaproteobacteria bacterium]